MVKHFNASNVVKWTKEYDPTRLVDTNSGGPANNLHVGDVNDIHSYPWPGNPTPSDTQYAMIGEFGGIGAFVDGHMWTPKVSDRPCNVRRERGYSFVIGG